MQAAAEEAFTAFAVSRVPALLRLAYVVTGDSGHAEDAVQAALVKVYAGWRRVQAAADPDAYVRRIVVNAALDGRRWRARRAPESFLAVDRVALDDVSGEVAAADAVRQLLAVLPPRQRAVLALRFLQDLSEAATAAELGISVGAVKSHTSRALARLRQVAEEEDGHARR